MKAPRSSFLLGAMLLLGVTPLAAQNSVDVLGGGPQPPNTIGCPANPNCMPANWSTTSNAGTDITAAITANFVFAAHGGASPADFPSATTGQICLADSRDLSGTTLFAQIAANCQAAQGVALLLIRDSAVTAPSAIPVFTVSTTDGDFLRSNVGFTAGSGVSKFQIRINAASPVAPGNPTGQHNCPKGQAAAAYVGSGTANYIRNESLCLPAGAGQAVEPSMIVDSQGTIYVESIRGVPGGLDLWRWNQAADGGPNTAAGVEGTLPFKYEGQPDCGIFLSTFCQKSGLAPGGGDGDVATNTPDPATDSANLAVVSLYLAEVTASRSPDRADSFTTPNVAVAEIPGDDRMWIDALDDPNHVYMEYHDAATTSRILVQRSHDGGLTYDDFVPPLQVLDATTQLSAGNLTGNIAGQIKVDRSHTGSHGSLYEIFVGADNPTDGARNNSNFINAVYVGVATNVSLASAVPLFADYKVFSCGAGSTCPPGHGLGNLFPALAVDEFGFVYAVWSDGADIYYSCSTTHGTSWSPAIKVTQGTPQAGKSNTFPWVAAEANGHVAIAWYGADQTGNSNTVPLTTQWNVFVAETVNGHATTPIFTFSQATDHSNHKGQISTGGLTGKSDRSLADFFQIAIDPTSHLVNIAYADNHAGPSVSYFTREKQAAAGIQMCGGHEADAQGEEAGRKGGKASFHVTHGECNGVSDSGDFSDPDSGTDFHSTHVDSASFDDATHSVTIAGSGTDNGSPVRFTIVAVDSSLVPGGLFSITLSDGYANSGTLLDGSITLH